MVPVESAEAEKRASKLEIYEINGIERKLQSVVSTALVVLYSNISSPT